MSNGIETLQNYLIEKRRRKQIEVSAKVDLLSQLNKIDAEKEMMGLTTLIDSINRKQNVLDTKIARKEESLSELEISLKSLSQGYDKFAGLNEIERTENTEKYGETLMELYRRKEDDLKLDTIYKNDLTEQFSTASNQLSQVKHAKTWLETTPVVNRIGPESIGPEDWSVEAYMTQYPKADEGIVTHMSEAYPMTDEKKSMLSVSEQTRLNVAQKKEDDRIARVKRESDAKQTEYNVKQTKLAVERADKAAGLKLAISGTTKSAMQSEVISLASAPGTELTDTGEFTYNYKAGDVVGNEILKKPGSVKYSSRREFIKENLIQKRLTHKEMGEIFTHVPSKTDADGKLVPDPDAPGLRALSLVIDMEQMQRGGATKEGLIEEGYGNIKKYLTGFEQTSPNRSDMHDVASLIKKNRDWLRGQKGGEGRARAYMSTIKKYFGISFGKDDKLIDYFIEPSFERSDKPLKAGDSIKRAVDFLEQKASWSPNHWRDVFKKMSKDPQSFNRKSKDQDIQLLWDIARRNYKNEKGIKKITDRQELLDYSKDFILELDDYFTGER
jgi:hypothetical protein